MPNKKGFFQDRTALLLISGNTFLALASVILVLLKINIGQGTDNYIVSYRASLGIDVYKYGTAWDILSFVVFALIIFGISMVLSYRTYEIKRELSLTVLSLTLPLLVFLIVVSNALLPLR